MLITLRTLSASFLTTIVVVLAVVSRADVTVLPFVEGSGTWPIVKLRIGPGASGNFLVDTGTPLSLITDGFAARCSLPVNPLTDDVKMATAKIPSTGYVDIQIAGIGSRNGDVRLMVVPSSYIPKLTVPVDGLIGNQVLSQAPSMFDFKLKKVFLWDKPGVDEGTLTALGMSGADVYKVPLYLDDNYIYHVDARINDTLTLRMVLDTGAEVPIVPEADAKRLHFGLRQEQVEVAGVDGATRGNAYVLDKMEIGPLEVRQVPVFGMPVKRTVPSDRVIGRSVLQYLRFFLNPQAAEVRLKPVVGAPSQDVKAKVQPSESAPQEVEAVRQVDPTRRYMWKPLYKPGETFTTRHSVTGVSDRLKDGNHHKSTTTQHLRYAVKAVLPDGTAIIDATILDTVTEIDGQRSEPVTVPNGKSSVTATFSPRGELISGWEQSRMSERMREISYFWDCVSPPHAVAAGDTWHTLVKSRAYAGKTIDETWTLESAAVNRATTLLTLHVKASLTFGAEPTEGFTVEGTLIVDQSSGMLKSRRIIFGNVPLSFPNFPDEVAIGTFTVEEAPEAESRTNAVGTGSKGAGAAH